MLLGLWSETGKTDLFMQLSLQEVSQSKIAPYQHIQYDVCALSLYLTEVLPIFAVVNRKAHFQMK